MQTKIIKADGTEQEVLPKDGKYFSLEEMQEIVGGFIEMISCNDQNFLCVLNEEGKINELPINEKATKLVDKIISPDDYLVGDVLITESKYVQ